MIPVALIAFAGTVFAQTTLNVITAGDQNMVDYVNNYLAPKFEAMNPGVKVRAVGTGPGDAGSQKIYEKLSAQQKAGNNEWDVDVAVIHQLASATMVNEKLLMPYRADVSAGKLVSRDTAKNALGANVDGYVLPMFHSQIAFAYNPELVKAPPKSFVELNEWVKKNPKQFGYNGVKGGMSGVGFVTGWVSAYSGLADKLEKGQVSDIIPVQGGFMIIKLDDKHAGGILPFELAQKEIFDIIWQQAVPPKMREFLTKLRTAGFIRTAEGYVDAGAAEKTDKTAVAKD